MPNLTSTTANNNTSAPASWTNITGLTGTITPASSGSVILLIACVPITFSATDASADFRFADGGSAITDGPVMTLGWSDNTDEGAHGMLVHALTGATGSHTYTIQWQDRLSTPTLDSGRTQSFQIIELLSAEATLQVDVDTLNSTADPASWADVTSMTGTFTPGASSVMLMLANIPTIHGANFISEFRFAAGGTREGPQLSQGFDATPDEGCNCGFMWATTTGQGASTAYALQWQARLGSNTLDSGRRQTFQVIELLSCDRLANDTATAGSAPASYADVPALSEAVTVGATTSVVLLLGAVAITLDTTDRTADFRFADEGTNEGPEMTLVYSDDVDYSNHGSMAWAKTGISGSKTFSLRWQDRTGTPAIDTGRVSTFQVLELKAVAGDVTRTVPQADLAIDAKTPAIAGGSWKAALNTDITDIELDTLCHIVFQLDHNGAAEANYVAQLEYNVDGAGWNDVNASSTNIRSVDSTRINDAVDVPQLLGSGTYLSTNAGYDDVNGASGGANLDWPDDATITEVNLQFGFVARSADLSGGEVIELRIKGLEAYDHTANLTIESLGGNVTVTPPQADMVISTAAPTLDETHVLSPPPADLVIDSAPPSVNAAHVQSPPQADLTIDEKTPATFVNYPRLAPQADLALEPKTPTIAGATWKAALNTDITDVALDAICHIVFQLDHNGAAEANYAAQLEYNVDSAGWNDVTATSTNIRSAGSTRIADGADVPQLLGSGAYLSTNAGFDDVDGASGGANLDWPEDATITEVNVQFAWVARSADLSGGENIALRVKGLEAYDHTANLTIVVSAEANGRHTGLLRNVGKMMR